MKEKNHREDSSIGIALGVIVSALTAWLVILLRQRRQPANFPLATEIASEGITMSETKTISAQEPQTGVAVVQNPMVEADLASSSRTDAVTSPDKKPSIWSPSTKNIVGVGLVIFILWVFYFSRGSITMVIFAGVLALVASGVIEYLKKHFKMKNGLAITITYLLIVLILIAIPFFVLPAIISSFSSLFNTDWTTVINNVAQRLDQLAAQLSMIPLVGSRMQDSLTALADLLEQSSTSAQNVANVAAPVITLESMAGGIGRTLGALASVLGPIISGVVSIVFLLLMSLQITIGGGVVRKGLVDILPPTVKDEINHLLDGTIFIWRSFLSGQVLLMFVMGVVTWLLNVLLGTPYPLFLGILAGFLELIPNLGPVIAWIPAALFALIFGSTRFVGLEPWVFALIVSAGYLLLSALENQLLVPRIMGNAVDLPPLVVLIGCIVGGSTLGIAGVFLAVPVMATGKEVFLYLYGKILETEGDMSPQESVQAKGRSVREFVQSTTARVRGWFGGRKNLQPK
jgi:predicted PurR-regulated permease PerM